LRLSHIFNWGGDVVEAFFSEVEAGAEAELPIEAKAVTAGNETKRDGAEAATPRPRQGRWRPRPGKQKHEENKM